MQNEFDNSGIKGIEEQDLGQVEVTPNQQETSAFPQFTDEAKQQRGAQDFKTLKKNFKKGLPHIPNLLQEFVPGADLARQFGVLGDIGGEQTYQPSTGENIAGGIRKIRQGDRVGGGVDVAIGGFETLGAASDVMMLGAGFTGPLAPVLLGAGVVLKGITKGGKAILQSKKGKTFFAKIKGNDIQTTPKADGDGMEQTIEVEELLAGNPEDVQELGNIDNLPITFTGTTSDVELTKDKRREPQRSRLNDTIDTLQNKATGEQFLATLRNKAQKGEFSMEELEQAGLDDYLKLKQNNEKPIPKSVIENYMVGNTPQLISEKKVVMDEAEQGGNYNQEDNVTFEDARNKSSFENEALGELVMFDRSNFINDGLKAALMSKNEGEMADVHKQDFFKSYEELTQNVNPVDLEETYRKFEELVKDVPSYEQAKQVAVAPPSTTEYLNAQVSALRTNLEKPKAQVVSPKENTFQAKLEQHDSSDEDFQNLVKEANTVAYDVGEDTIIQGTKNNVEKILKKMYGDDFETLARDGEFQIQKVDPRGDTNVENLRGVITPTPSTEDVLSQYFNRTDTLNAIIEGDAKRMYEDMPLERYRDESTEYFIEGNDIDGYEVYDDQGEYLTSANNFEEARARATARAYDAGLISEEGALYGDFTTGLGDPDTYEEIPYYIDSRKSRDAEFDLYSDELGNNHYKQKNNVGHIRSILIPSTEPYAKNRSIYLVEEFQTDPGNLARMEGGYKPTQKNINELEKIIGDDKLEFSSGLDDLNDGTYTIDGTVDGKRVTYSYNDPYDENIEQNVGFTVRLFDTTRGEDIEVPHPKNKEILEYLNKNNLNLEGRVSADMPLKNKTHEFNFRKGLAEAVDKNQSHMFFVAGEVHALRYDEALRLDGFDRVPDRILQKQYKKFKSGTFEAFDAETVGITFVTGKDGEAIPLPFSLNKQPSKFQGKIEAYAQNKTSDNFFDDLMMVDMNFGADYYSSQNIDTGEAQDFANIKVRLLVDKKNDDVLGMFYSEQPSGRTTRGFKYRRRPSQDRDNKFGAHENLNMENYFHANKLGIKFEEGADGYDATPLNLKEVLTKDEIKELKKDTSEADYFDQFTDINTQGRVLGGKGKKDLYNNIIKKYAQKYIQKIDPDAKIFYEVLRKEDGGGDFVPTYGFEITPKIRKKILEDGIETFSKGGAVLILKDKQKKIPTKKYVPQIIRKSYGTFVDKDNNKWDYIDG